MVSTNCPRALARRTSATTLLAVALLLLAACGQKSNPHPKTLDPYVAMGDSYTSLAGDGPYTDATCRRSTENYPNLVAKALGTTSFTDASCGGATTEALTTDQSVGTPPVTRPPQMNALSRKTKLVTIGIGLNNPQAGGVTLSYALLYLCAPVNGITNGACATYLALPQSTLDDAIKNMTSTVKSSLKQIRAAAPNARIILVGYPRVVADDSDCPTQLPLPAAAVTRLRYGLKLVNQEYATMAKQARVDYIDMWTASKGHDVCSAEPWVNGIADVPGKALQFHPYAAYARAVADKIVALLTK